MQVSNGQLLKQLHRSTRQLLGQSANPEHQSLLAAMGAVINELLLRDDQQFYLDFYRGGRNILGDALPEPAQCRHRQR